MPSRTTPHAALVLALASLLVACGSDPSTPSTQSDSGRGGDTAANPTDVPRDAPSESSLRDVLSESRDAYVTPDAVPVRDSSVDAPTTDGGATVVVGDCTGGTGATRPECVCASRTETPCYPGPAAQVNVGICRPGRSRCDATGEFGRWAACTGAVLPAAETCDGVDNDCDGTVDDGCACRPGTTRECYTGPTGTQGVGRCRAGTQACAAGAGGVGSSWGACTGETRPATETCNAIDDDCNGRADDGVGCTCRGGATQACYPGASGTLGVGVCRAGTQTCDPSGTRWGTCTGAVAPSAERCNRLDDDCDGAVDEVAECSGPSATCPGPITAPAGTPVPVSVTVSPGVSCRWEVVTRPAGAGSEGSFANPMACSTTFNSVIVGTYVLRVTVTDAFGRTGTCAPTVILTGRGLRVELSWATTGDVDLHLLHPSATAWFSRPHDCYFANTRPTWDAAGGQSPGLDVDNIAGFGPENIRIDTPVVGQVYRIGVHAYSRVDAGSMSTVRVYCGDSTTPARTYTRSVRSGSPSGNNDLWRVTDVRIDALGRCTFTDLEDVITSTAAHAGR